MARIPILKLNNGETDYYPLTLTQATITNHPIRVRDNIGGFKKGEEIAAETSVDDILTKLFSKSVGGFKIDTYSLVTNRRGEIAVNRNALFILDDDTVVEDRDNIIKVNKEALISGRSLKVLNDKIEVDVMSIIDGKTLRVNKFGTISINPDLAVRVDNVGIVKDSHHRLCLNQNAIRVDGKYIVKDKRNKICLNVEALENLDNEYLVKSPNGNNTINTEKVVTTEDDQHVSGIKTFDNGISVGELGVSLPGGVIESEGDGIVVRGLKDVDEAKTATTRGYVDAKFGSVDTYASIPVFKALNLVSKYEVYATVDKISAGDRDAATGLNYSVDVPASSIEVLKIRSSQIKDDQNVIVDWGDGTTINLRTCSTNPSEDIGVKEGLHYYFGIDDNEKIYVLTHIYPEQNKKYIVSVYGSTYWGLHHMINKGNLVSRVFDSDLPIANCVKSVSDFCNQSGKLLKVDVPAYYSFSGVQNFSGCFKRALNLKRVKGFSKYLFNGSIRYACSVFEDCCNMEYCDAHLAGDCGNYQKGNNNFFTNCLKLKSDLVTMLPSGGFSKKIVSMYEVFKNCHSLICNDWDYVASVLWGDTSKDWINTERCFEGCSPEIRSHVPESWGGTKIMMFNDDVLILRDSDDIYKLVGEIAKVYKLGTAIATDSDLYETLKKVADLNNVEVVLTNKDSELVPALETVVLALGAKQLITLF